MQTVILLGLVSLLTDISSEMVYPLLSLYLTTSLGATGCPHRRSLPGRSARAFLRNPPIT